MAIIFEVIEKLQNERGVQVLELEVRGTLLQPTFGKRKEQSKAIPIGLDGASTGMALLDQAVNKELL